MKPKPSHLSKEYASQFQDDCVAAVYRKRPPYPEAVFDLLEGLLPSRDLPLLDLGCGTGEIAVPMSRRVARVEAIDVSARMLEIARASAAETDNIRWINEAAEAYSYPETYGLVVNGQSLGWMDWEVVLSKVRRRLYPKGFLAIVELQSFVDAPWAEELSGIIRRYSTNQEYRRVDLVRELTDRQLYVLVGREVTAPEPFEQSIDDYVESFHARNGFSRARMSTGDAREFDAEVRRVAKTFAEGGFLKTHVRATVSWGVPGAA